MQFFEFVLGFRKEGVVDKSQIWFLDVSKIRRIFLKLGRLRGRQIILSVSFVSKVVMFQGVECLDSVVWVEYVVQFIFSCFRFVQVFLLCLLFYLIWREVYQFWFLFVLCVFCFRFLVFLMVSYYVVCSVFFIFISGLCSRYRSICRVFIIYLGLWEVRFISSIGVF